MSENYNKKSHEMVWATIARLSQRSGFVARTLEIAGYVAQFAGWECERGFGSAKRYNSRTDLWESIAPRFRGQPLLVLEFGVAGGAATRQWLELLPGADIDWHGFDAFTGLPQSWMRGGVEFTPAGAFDAGGRPPDIVDSRVTWHVGLVQDTLPELEFERRGALLVLFDLDIYDPTNFAIRWLEDRFRPGDVLYFDEAYDAWHERRLIDEFLADGHRLRSLGSTGIAIAFEYLGREQPTSAGSATAARPSAT